MADLIVRDLETDVVERLRHRAARLGCGIEEAARRILRDAVNGAAHPAPEPRLGLGPGLGSRIAARFENVGLDRDLPELHSHCAASEAPIDPRKPRRRP